VEGVVEGADADPTAEPDRARHVAADPPATCASDQRQIEVEIEVGQGDLTAAQNALDLAQTVLTARSNASLISLDSMQNQMVAQVPETQIGQIHVGQKAQATLPAAQGSNLTVTVSQIERTPVMQSGQTYFRVDLVSSAKSADEFAYHPDAIGAPAPGSPMVGFTVDVNF
jgi:hypothetical protein